MAGAAFCMVPYASEVVLAQAVPYGMTDIMLPAGGFVSGETIMTAAMATGYTVTGSNMLVKVNDSVVGLTGTNMMALTMGIGEAKYGSSKLTNTMDGMQMSDTWINGGDN